mgnify:FL=1
MNKWEKPEINHGELTKFNYIVQYPENLDLGTDIDIGTFTYINSEFGVKIGSFVKIGSHCSIYSNSTIDKKCGQIIIEENCKIGSHSTIMPGITIGKNSTIAAHSFVNSSIPPNELWGGIPAKFMKKIQ